MSEQNAVPPHPWHPCNPWLFPLFVEERNQPNQSPTVPPLARRSVIGDVRQSKKETQP